MSTASPDFRVMTSGAFTAAHFALIPAVEQLTGGKVVTVTTSIGTGETSIPSRLKRGEQTDLVIVAEPVLRQFIADGLVRAEHATVMARSMIGFAVRAGSPDPQIRSAEDLKRALLAAKAIGYSASESGKYFTGELVQRLGIADAVLPKSRLIGGGERVGTAIARGDLDFGFQQMSELLPVAGVDIVGELPGAVQKTTRFSIGLHARAPEPEAARALARFLASAAAAPVIRARGMQPLAG